MGLAPRIATVERSGDRVRVRGRQWTIVARAESADCASIRLVGIGHDRTLTLLTPFDRVVPLARQTRPHVVGRRRWLHDLDGGLLAIHPFGSLPSAASAPIRLLPYQLEPAMLVARDGTSRILIADAVGLGKTIQAGLVLLELARHDDGCRALVLAPAGLREQWRMELSTRLGLSAVVADSRWLGSIAAERPAHINPWSMPGIYVASHDLVKRPEVLRPLEDVTWDAVVIDEAHGATSGTDRRAALHAIAVRSRHVVLLTATPHDGDWHERDALCCIGQAGADDEPVVMFRRSRLDVRQGSSRRTRVLAVIPSRAERRMHELLERYSRRVWEEAGARDDDRARLVSIVLRKRALSSAASLQISIERRMTTLGDTDGAWQPLLPLGIDRDEDPIGDDRPGAELGAPGLSDARLERACLTAIADAACDAAGHERKVARLLRFLSRVREPVIVFTEYRDTLTRLADRLVSAGHAVLPLHGGLSAGERADVQRAFNERGGTLLATDAASEGLNLHHRCRVVVHFELPWNPSRLEQRAGRVDRLGQTKPVHELALVLAHTAERLVLSPLAVRLAAAGAAGRRTLAALSEASVAASVMTGQPLPDTDLEASHPAPSIAVHAPSDLVDFAEVEAARLERHRLLAVRSQSQREAPRGAVVATHVRSRTVASGLYLVFVVSIRSQDGSIVHAQPGAIRVDLAPEFNAYPRLSRRELQALIEALVPEDGGRTGALARGHAGDTLERIIGLALARSRRLRQRDDAIARALAGAQLASERLVQAGLFDRRSLQAAARRASTLAALEDQRRIRLSMSEREGSLARHTELLAAIHVTPGR